MISMLVMQLTSNIVLRNVYSLCYAHLKLIKNKSFYVRNWVQYMH